MRRVSEFDALRGLAAVAVILFHLQNQPGTWTHFGFTGVHLFLILSGYLITGIILRHAGSPGFLRAFFARRALRIWPIYYLTIAFLVIYQRYFYFNPPSLSGLPYYLTFTQYLWSYPGLANVLPHPRGVTIHGFDQSWTLALEEQFYLLWPLAILLCGRRMIVPMIAAIVALGVWVKTQSGPDGNFSWLLPYVAGSFAMGGLIALILRDPAQVKRCRPLLSLGFLLSGAAGFAYVYAYYGPYAGTLPSFWSPEYAPYWHSFQNYAFYTLHFGIVGFVAVNAGAWFLAPLRMKELVYLGEISYGLYLYHVPVYWLVNNAGRHNATNDPWTVWVAKIAITFVVATLSYRYIERPILRLKKYFPYGSEVEADGAVEAQPEAAPRSRRAAPAPPVGVQQPRMVYARPRPLGSEAPKQDGRAASKR